LAPEGTPLFHSRFGSFAPRFGAAYQLSSRGGWETTLRGGAGVFYDLGLGNIATAFQNIYPFFASKTVGSSPFPLSAAIRTPPVLGVDPPQQFTLLDPNLRLPYTIQWNTTWEQGLGQAQTITLNYVGAAGRRLLLAQQYFQRLAEWPSALTFITVQRSRGQSDYNGLQLQYQRRLRKGLQALASYTLSRSMDNASLDDASVPPASLSSLLAQSFGPSDFDVRHVFSTALTYEVPRLSRSSVWTAISRDFGVDLLVRYQSAPPVTPVVGFQLLPNGVTFTPRPNLVPGQPLYINDPNAPDGRRFNSAAFVAPPLGTQGNFPRNGLRGFPAAQVDLALHREFKLHEVVRLQLRAELFNLFNHPNFGTLSAFPSNSISQPLFGQPTQMLNRSLGGLNALYQMGGPRSGQLALRLIW
jgi:hypothetical protein